MLVLANVMLIQDKLLPKVYYHAVVPGIDFINHKAGYPQEISFEYFRGQFELVAETDIPRFTQVGKGRMSGVAAKTGISVKMTIALDCHGPTRVSKTLQACALGTGHQENCTWHLQVLDLFAGTHDELLIDRWGSHGLDGGYLATIALVFNRILRSVPSAVGGQGLAYS